MRSPHRVPDPTRSAFARTNLQTIAQRARLLSELAPGLRSVAEVCCGDCQAQAETYAKDLGIARFIGLDVDPRMVAAARARGLDCRQADALDPDALRTLLDIDVVFFGPPLSEDCDGHRLLAFDDVRPAYRAFVDLFLGDLGFGGLLVCIGPRSTTTGDAVRLVKAIQRRRPELGLGLFHRSVTTLTGAGVQTAPRLKYVELWLSPRLGDAWETRESVGWPDRADAEPSQVR